MCLFRSSQVSGKFWLDREQHPSHLSKRTVETAAQRKQLLVELEKLEKTTAVTKPKQRKKATSSNCSANN